MASDYYGILGLTFDATPDEIRAAYFDAARRLHPDVNPDPSSNELFIRVQEAYQILTNPVTRAEVDARLSANLDPNPAIALNFHLSRPALNRLDEPQLVYLLLELIPTTDPEKIPQPPLNLCLVVDCSTSMQGERIETVKANLSQIFRSLKRTDTVTVVAFSDRAEVVVPPTLIQDLPKTDKRVYLLKTGGGTEIYQGLKLGFDQIQSSARPAAVQQLILITDGHTYGDEQACLALAQQARQAGIAISAVGIGDEWNDILLDQIASMSGGSTGFISSPRDLTRFLEEKILSFTQLYASGLELSFRPNPLVGLRYAFRLNPEITPVPAALPLALGSLRYRTSLSLLFEFSVASLPQETSLLHLLTGWLYLDVFGQRPSRSRLLVDIHLPVTDEVQSGLPPSVFLEALSRVTLYRMQEKARAEVSDGNIASATRRLQHLATNLLAHGDQDLAHTVLMEAENLRQNEAYSKDGDKRIKYGTRVLLLPSGNGGLH